MECIIVVLLAVLLLFCKVVSLFMTRRHEENIINPTQKYDEVRGIRGNGVMYGNSSTRASFSERPRGLFIMRFLIFIRRNQASTHQNQSEPANKTKRIL
jgi:hypothetical protein